MAGAYANASLPLIDPPLLWLARLQRLRGARLQPFCPREVVVREGEIPEVLGVVALGAVAVSARAECGRVATLLVLGQGDLLGHQGVASAPVPASVPGAVALVHSTVLTVPASSVAPALYSDRVLLGGFAAAIAEQLDRAQESLSRALLFPVARRLRCALRDLADRHGTRVPGGTKIMLPLSQDLLASIVGATRESVNRALGELRRDGAVRIDDGEYIWTEIDD